MSKLNNTKRGALLSLFVMIFLVSNANAQSFVLENENNIIANKTVVKIEEIASESKAKLNINIYLILKESINERNLWEYIKANHIDKLKPPYVVYMLSKKRKLIDIFVSNEALNRSFDKDEVVQAKTIKLITSPGSKSPPQALYSAALLNGFSELCEEIAEDKNIVLQTAIGSESSDLIDIMRYVLYSFMVIVGFLFLKKFTRMQD